MKRSSGNFCKAEQIVKYGDGVYVPPDVLHGAVCIEEGVLIDVFSPVREDFPDGSEISYVGKKYRHAVS